jgi:hypothetical protein
VPNSLQEGCQESADLLLQQQHLLLLPSAAAHCCRQLAHLLLLHPVLTSLHHHPPHSLDLLLQRQRYVALSLFLLPLLWQQHPDDVNDS